MTATPRPIETESPQSDLNTPTSSPGDGDLLESFLRDRDEHAFAELLCRHGPMVLGVCRRILGDVPDIDDAFQATFLVLFRKGDTVRPRDKVGPWLHGVARRVAFKAKGLAARRHQREQPLGDYSIDGPPEPRDWLPLLDRELGMLPEKYRSAIVLCDLQGQSRHDAAARLRLSEGTLSSRLARGRALLGDRLKRRGVILSAALVAFGNSANAAVPPTLVSNTTAVVLADSAKGMPALLCQGVIKAMFVKKVVNSLAAVLVAAAFGIGALAGSHVLADGDKPAKPNPDKPAKPNAEKPAKPAGEAFLGRVKAIDAAKQTLTVLRQVPGTKETKEETLALAKDVMVALEHGSVKESKAGKLSDLAPGDPVSVQLSEDKKSVTHISVRGQSVFGGIKSFDAAKNAVTLLVKDEKMVSEKTIELMKDAKVILDDGIGNKNDPPKQGKLTDLAEGLHAVVQLSGYDRSKGVGIRITGPTVHGTITGIDPGNSTVKLTTKGEGEQTYTVSKGARMNKGKLADIVNGSQAQLRLSVEDKKTVVAINVKE